MDLTATNTLVGIRRERIAKDLEYDKSDDSGHRLEADASEGDYSSENVLKILSYCARLELKVWYILLCVGL